MNEETNVINQSQTIDASPSNLESEGEMQATFTSKIKKALLESSVIWQILKLILYATFGIGIYVFLVSPKIVTMTKYSLQSSIVNAEQVVINKDIRGIFPPLYDDQGYLVAKWSIKTGEKVRKEEKQIDDIYTLEFKWSRYVYVMRSKCKGDIRLSWKTYFNNIKLKFPKLKKSESDSMIIKNLPQDEECIIGQGKFIQKILTASIWTVYDENLYLLLQDELHSKKPNQMMIFQWQR